MAPIHVPLRIVTIRGGAALIARLTDMGLNIGSEVRVVQHSGAGLVVARGETRFALGGGMAHKVLVTVL